VVGWLRDIQLCRSFEEVDGMNWLVPWHPLPNRSADDPLVVELHRELCNSHKLFGVPVCPIGKRQDCDDVLFRLLDGSNRLAVVHLTFAQHPEPDPIWPSTRLFDSWEHFEQEAMKLDHEDFTSEI
jgi:hypothetical protein